MARVQPIGCDVRRYYVPDLSEWKYGCDWEYQLAQGAWGKLPGHPNFVYVQELITERRIRAPLLTEETILESGWSKIMDKFFELEQWFLFWPGVAEAGYLVRYAFTSAERIRFHMPVLLSVPADLAWVRVHIVDEFDLFTTKVYMKHEQSERLPAHRAGKRDGGN